MTKTQSIIVVTIMVALAATSLIALYLRSQDDELDIYVAFFESYADPSDHAGSAFVGTVSTCGASDINFKEFAPGLQEALAKANGPGAKPRSLSKLTTHANIASDTVLENFRNDQTVRIPIDKNLVSLSRVGVGPTGNDAVLCVDSGYMLGLVGFSRSESSKRWLFKIFEMVAAQ